MKQTELEINYKIKDTDGLLADLRKCADGQELVQKITMTYFESPTDKSFYVRIEEIEVGGNQEKRLTYKHNFMHKDGLKKCDEHSVSIDNKEFYTNFLQIVGLELINEKSKIRHMFDIDGLTVTVDRWDREDMGDHLEIEGSDEKAIKKLAKGLARFLGEID